MPVGYNQDVELRIAAHTTGGDDVDKLAGQINGLEADLRDFEKVGKSISVLEGAQDRVENFKQSLSLAQGRVKQLQATLSEAFNVGMEAPGIKALEKDLAAAQRAAVKAEADLKSASNTVDRLDASGAKAGVTVANLAAKKAQLATESDKVKQKVDALRASLDQSAAAEKNLAAGTNSVNAAFATLNIRSAAKINADIESINQALVRLASNSKVSGADFDRAYAGAQVRLGALRAELAGTEAAAGKTSTAVSGMGASLAGLAGMGAALAIGREFITANVGAESLERTLVQLTGSGEAAAAEIEYLKAASNRLGLSLQESSRAYISLTAAAKGTSLEGAGTRQIFEAVAGAMAKLGKSSADTEGALQAVSQMMGKGTVSMEEMRQQLAERLPGAMQATANAVGVTVGELTEMISSGQVLASDLLPKMAEGLQKMYGSAGQAEGSVAAWNRLKNAINETYTFIGNSGVWLALVTILEGTSKIVSGLTAGFDFLGRTGGNTAAFLTEVWKNPSAALSRYREEQVRAHEETIGALRKSLAATEQAATGQNKLALATQAGGAAAEQGSVSWLAIVNAYAKVNLSAKEGVESSVKSAAARAEEGKAAVALAQAFGSETEKRTAALNEAKNNAEALRTVADARRLEAEVARSNLIALQESTKAEGALTEEKRKQISAVEQQANSKRSEAEQSAALSLAAQQHSAALATETEMLKDNSGRLTELKAAADAAGVALENMRKLKEQGVATDKQVKDAEIAGAQAKALYRDALNDQTKAIEYNAAMKGKETDLKAAGLRLEIEQIRSMAEVAKAYGDETTAAAYLAQAKQLEIELAELQAKAKRFEAESTLQVIKAKRAELQASGDLTVEKEREIKAQEMGAQVKLKEAEIADETANRMRQLAAATADGANSAESAAGSYDKLAGSLRGVEDAAAGAGNGVRNVSGSSLGKMGGSSSQADFTETLYRRGGSVEEVKAAAKYVGELYAREQATKLTGNLGNSENAARLQKLAINTAVDEALRLARQELKTGQAVDLGASVGDLQARNLAKTPLKSLDDMISRIKYAGNEEKQQPAKTIRLEFASGGKTSAVHADDEESANAFIKTLEAAGMRAAR